MDYASLVASAAVSDGADRGGFVKSSGRCRSTAVLAGLSSVVAVARAYGESYPGPARAEGLPSGSSLVDLARRLLPDDELEWLALFGSPADGVSMAAIGMRVAGGSLASTVGANVTVTGIGPGVDVDVDGREAIVGGSGPASPPLSAAAASAFACASAFVGRPRFRLGGGSVGEG